MKVVKLTRLPVDQLDPDENQPRRDFDEEELLDLASSQRELGHLQPIVAAQVGERYRIVEGERRWRAASLSGQSHVLTMIVEDIGDHEDVLVIQLVANCLRAELKPTEKALALVRLKENRGWSHSELAKALHTSSARVTESLALLTLPEEIQTKVDSGEIGRSTAYAIAREEDDESRSQLVRDALSGQLTREAACQQVKRRRVSDSATARVRVRLGGVSLTVAAAEPITLDALIEVLGDVSRKARRARKQGLDSRGFALRLEQDAQKARRAHISGSQEQIA